MSRPEHLFRPPRAPGKNFRKKIPTEKNFLTVGKNFPPREKISDTRKNVRTAKELPENFSVTVW